MILKFEQEIDKVKRAASIMIFVRSAIADCGNTFRQEDLLNVVTEIGETLEQAGETMEQLFEELLAEKRGEGKDGK